MRKTFSVLVVLVFVLSLYSCGGGGGGNGGSSHAPSISNLYYSPHSVSQGAGGGAVTVSGTFDFIDHGGDLGSLTILAYQSGILIDTITTPITGAGGVTVGYLNWYATGVSTASVANYTFEIYVTDGNSANSNKLTGTFSVI